MWPFVYYIVVYIRYTDYKSSEVLLTFGSIVEKKLFGIPLLVW